MLPTTGAYLVPGNGQETGVELELQCLVPYHPGGSRLNTQGVMMNLNANGILTGETNYPHHLAKLRQMNEDEFGSPAKEEINMSTLFCWSIGTRGQKYGNMGNNVMAK